jgi:hypothetical protein
MTSTDDYHLAAAKQLIPGWNHHPEIEKLVIKYRKDLYEMKNDSHSPFHTEISKLITKLLEEPIPLPESIIRLNQMIYGRIIQKESKLNDFWDKSPFPNNYDDYAHRANNSIYRYYETKIKYNNYIKEQEIKLEKELKMREEQKKQAEEYQIKKEKERIELEELKIKEEARKRIEKEKEEFAKEIFEAKVKAEMNKIKTEQLDELEKFFSS